MSTNIEIYFKDLPEHLQEKVAKAYGIPKEEVLTRTNLDVFPFVTREVYPLEFTRWRTKPKED